MAAAYPSVIPSFTVKVNQTDVNWADHVNRLQDEVVALARELGTIPKAGFADVAARLTNLEDTFADASHTHDTRYVQLSLATTKGSLLVSSAAGAFVALDPGSDGQALLSDSSQPSGTKWASIRHDDLPGLANDDHPQYLNTDRHNSADHLAVFASRSIRDLGDVTNSSPSVNDVPRWNGEQFVFGSAPSSDTSDHGSLSGLDDDDHPQYLNDARHDDRARHDALGLTHNSLTGLTTGDPHTQYALVAGAETISGQWNFSQHPNIGGTPAVAGSDGTRRVFVRSDTPTGTITNGDLWFRP